MAADAKGKLFAGVGASAEIGVEFNGVYDKKGNSNNRLLAKANFNVTLEAGFLMSFGAEFGGESSEVINKATFSKKTFSIAVGMVAGTEFKVNILVLEEITDDIKDAAQKYLQAGKSMTGYLLSAETDSPS